MKYIYQIIALFSIALFFTTCKKDSGHENVIYLTAAETNVATSITVDGTGEMAITAKTSQVVTQPVTANIVIDTSLIAAYNQRTGKHYSALPQGSYELTGNMVTVAPGANITDAIKLRILSTSGFKDGVSYIVPVTIKDAGTPILNASATLYVAINRVIISTVASLANNYFTVDFSTNNSTLTAMTNITYETKVMVNQFQAASPFISSIMGIEENFLMRFGDVTIPNGNQLQIAGGLTATTVPNVFTTGTWYHLAAVYNGSRLTVYIDGVPVATKDAVRTVDLTNTYKGGFHFGYSDNGRLLNGAISEARVWSRPLSQAEIINGMCGIDPASPGLVGYWKFNEGTGNTARDISGHGYDAVANRTVTWIPNIRCN